jgi:xylulose-5-phosphate/fructose-6-phosphate phosphoketolase
MDKAGLDAFCKSFSWPGGFPSHVNAETPGQIHEGGELGYALAVAYGSVMDNPDLITVAVIGDGESETGPTATAWHAHKYLDPAESGAVLPILHANGFKISERTLPGTMDDKEVVALFTGYGYQCCIVEYQNMANPTAESDRKLQHDFYCAMRWAYAEIRAIQKDARSGKPRTKPRFPMIFLRSPKGWTGPKALDGLPIVNSFRSHQVPLPEAATSDEQFGMLQDWLASYGPEKLFNTEGNVIKNEVLRILPDNPELRLGQTLHARPPFQPLELAESWEKYGVKVGEQISPMKAIGKLLVDVVKDNPTRFRMFSPDELRSNKLDAVLEHTTRNFQWDPETAHKGGRVIEMLSEHTLQGFAQGYALTGRYSIFPSYEAFLSIVDTSKTGVVTYAVADI